MLMLGEPLNLIIHFYIYIFSLRVFFANLGNHLLLFELYYTTNAMEYRRL